MALNLAVALAEKGNATLLVDVDPLGAIGLSLAKSNTEWSGIAEYIVEKFPLAEAIIKTKLPSLSILPRGRLDALDISLYEHVFHSTDVVREMLASVRDDYRYVIIDTPSDWG